jgi:hypothetical protein
MTPHTTDVAEHILGRLGLGGAASPSTKRPRAPASKSGKRGGKQPIAAAKGKGTDKKGVGAKGGRKKKDGRYGRGDETDFPELLPVAASSTWAGFPLLFLLLFSFLQFSSSIADHEGEKRLTPPPILHPTRVPP